MEQVIKSKEELMKEIDAKIEMPWVTAKFGDNWRQFYKKMFEKEQVNVDMILDIAWRNGRKSILLENALEDLLTQFEGKQGWVKAKPVFDRECVFVTANKYSRNTEDLKWDYCIWQIKTLAGENDKGESAWYWGLLTGDGEEWGDLADLCADWYLIIGNPGESADNPTVDNIRVKEENETLKKLVDAATDVIRSVPIDDTGLGSENKYYLGFHKAMKKWEMLTELKNKQP